MAALGDRGRHGYPVRLQAPDAVGHAGPSEPATAGQAAPRDAESDNCAERWPAVPGALDPWRRQSGSGAAASPAEHSRFRDVAAGSGGGAALPERALLRIVRLSRVCSREVEPGGQDCEDDRRPAELHGPQGKRDG